MRRRAGLALGVAALSRRRLHRWRSALVARAPCRAAPGGLTSTRTSPARIRARRAGARRSAGGPVALQLVEQLLVLGGHALQAPVRPERRQEQAHLAGERVVGTGDALAAGGARRAPGGPSLWASATSLQGGSRRAQTRPSARDRLADARAGGGPPLRSSARCAASSSSAVRSSNRLRRPCRVEPGHAGAAIGLDGDEALGRERAQGGPHRVAGDAVALGQLALGQPLAGRRARRRRCACAVRVGEGVDGRDAASSSWAGRRISQARRAGSGTGRRAGSRAGAAGAQREQGQAAQHERGAGRGRQAGALAQGDHAERGGGERLGERQRGGLARADPLRPRANST